MTQKSTEELQQIIEQMKTPSYFIFKGPDLSSFEQLLAPHKGKIALSGETSNDYEISVVREGNLVKFEGDWANYTQLMQFIQLHNLPICPVSTPDVLAGLFIMDKPITLLSIDPANQTEKLADAFSEAAKELSLLNSPRCVFSIMNNQQYTKLI